MGTVRQPAVAGQFYPGDASQLRHDVERYVGESKQADAPVPKAIIAPHAGYIYSGPIAGSAYAALAKANGTIRRVVLLGPAHWAAVTSMASSSADAFATPLGLVPLDLEAQDIVNSLPQVVVFDGAHQREHGLEVQLPFLQHLFSDFTLVPLVVGDATATEVSEILDRLWGGPETVIVISSDLSHYLDYETATRQDKSTSTTIEALQPLREGQACGGKAINGLLLLARQRGLSVQTVDLRNSGDTAGPRDRVVGYGAFLFTE